MKAETRAAYRELLRAVGLRMTGGRVDILDVLLRAHRPLTEDEIRARLKREVDRTTVYRNLEHFMVKNLVHRCFVRERAWHYELAHNCGPKQCHPHFCCTKCGRMVCLTEVSVPLARKLPEGFELKRQQVRIEGLCPRCSRAEKEKTSRKRKKGR